MNIPNDLTPLEKDDIFRIIKSLVRDEVRRRLNYEISSKPSMRHESEGAFDWNNISYLDSLLLIAVCKRISSFFQLKTLHFEDKLIFAQEMRDWVTTIYDARAEITSLELQTSGTTGAPKHVVHPLQDLWREAVSAEILPGCLGIACTVPSHHAYGLIFGVLAPRIHERQAVDVQAHQIQKGLQYFDTIVTNPHIIYELQEELSSHNWEIVTSGSPLYYEKITFLTTKNRVIDVFGSTETLGLGLREQNGPFKLFKHRQWSGIGDGNIECVTGRQLEVQDFLKRQGLNSFIVDSRRDGKYNSHGCLIDPSETKKLLVEKLSSFGATGVEVKVIDNGEIIVFAQKTNEKKFIQEMFFQVLLSLPSEIRNARLYFLN